MFFDTLYTVLSVLFAFGLFMTVRMIVLYFEPQKLRPAVIKVSDILTREGYDTPPRTRRSKELAHV